MNEPAQTQLTASTITRELDREINRARFRKDGQELGPRDYIDALDEAAPAAWTVNYTQHDDFNDRKSMLIIILTFLTLNLALPSVAWTIHFPKPRTGARLTIHAEDKDLTSEGTAKGTEDLSKKEALAQAIQDLIKENSRPEAYIQESRPRSS